MEIESSRENKDISKEIRGRGFNQQRKQFWLGLTDRRREGQWVYESTRRVCIFVLSLFFFQLVSKFCEHSHFSEAKIYKLGVPST